MTFSYQAFDAKGVASSGELDATTADEATQQLRRKGLFVSSIEPAGRSARPTAGGGKKAMSTGKKLRYLAMFSRQLQVLVSSGTPLVQALSAIERQAEDPQWQSVLVTLRTRVEEGSPLSEGMRQHTNVFDPVAISLVSAGEASGDMSAMLERMAQLCRKQLQLRTAVTGALVYPCLLIAMGVCVTITMLVFVLPRFADLFAQLDSPLPPTTKFLMALSSLLINYWWAIVPALVGVGFAGRAWFRSEAGRLACETNLLRLPKVGVLIRSLLTAQLARMLGTLLESRVTLIDALKLTKDAVTHSRYLALLTAAEDAVGRGEPISLVLAESELISPSVQEAIRTGEQSGRLGTPLLQMADFLDEENDTIVKSITRLLEPLILITLGVLVGFIAMSVFLPLFDLVSSTQQGGH
jgi:type II secretory pathway component PulF